MRKISVSNDGTDLTVRSGGGQIFCRKSDFLQKLMSL